MNVISPARSAVPSSAVPRIELPSDRARTVARTGERGRETCRLPASLAARLDALAHEDGLSRFSCLLAAFRLLLYRYTQQSSIAIGVILPHAGGRACVPIACEVTEGITFRALAHRMHAALSDAHPPRGDAGGGPQDRPAACEIICRDESATPTSGAFVTNGKAFAAGQPLQAGGPREIARAQIDADAAERASELTLLLAEQAGDLAHTIVYDADLFERQTLQRLVEHWRALLAGVTGDPDRAVEAYELFTPSARNHVLHELNGTRRDYGTHHLLHGLIEAQAEATPDAPAVIFDGVSLDYRTLNARANQLARHLAETYQVGPESLVGIHLERSAALIVSLLAVLKAGGAYLPLEPALPPQRIDDMLADARPRVVLTTAALAGRLSHDGCAMLPLDAAPHDAIIAAQDADNPAPRVSPDGAAYVIYTSGSTGRPKGVVNTHRGICNRLLWMQEAYQATPADRMLQKTPMGFDVSVWEFFWPLTVGAALVVARPGEHRDSRALLDLIVRERVTILHFVPSMLRAFLDEPGLDRAQSVRLVVASGEALTGELQTRYFSRWTPRLENLYGPTEAAVDVSAWRCEPAHERSRPVPIGFPIANIRLLILDPRGRLCPVGAAGELHIGGIGLARGYCNRPALTADRFIPDAFSTEPGGRLYRTGDLARYGPNGAIEYLGRLDHQVKIRGARIELGEIEAVLERHAGVRQAGAAVWRAGTEDASIVAYVVPAGAGAIDTKALRTFLGQHLPIYMIPADWMVLDALPLTPSGKLDRRALPMPAISQSVSSPALADAADAETDIAEDVDAGDTAPGVVAATATAAASAAATAAASRHVPAAAIAWPDATQATLAQLWAETLLRPVLAQDDTFLDLGGHSLLLMQLARRIQTTFGVDVPLTVLFDTETVAEMADVITERQAEQLGADGLAELMADLQQLSDDEVRTLLEAGR